MIKMNMIDEAINKAIEKLRNEVDPKFEEIKTVLQDIQNEQVAIKKILERMG